MEGREGERGEGGRERGGREGVELHEREREKKVGWVRWKEGNWQERMEEIKTKD